MATRTAASGGYESIPGTLLTDFATLADWTKGASGTIEADAVNTLTGAASLKLNAAAGETVTATKTIVLDMSGQDGVSFSVFVPDRTNLSTIGFVLSNDAGITAYHAFNQTSAETYLENGWNTLTLPKSFFTSTSGVWTGKIRLQMKIIAGAGGTASVSFDSVYIGRRTRAKFIFNFDDFSPEVYTIAFPIMEAKGFKGVGYLVGQRITNPSVIYATSTQVQELHAAGWDIGNHSYSHDYAISASSKEAILADLLACDAILESLGVGDAKKYHAYPGGIYNDNYLAALAEGGYRTGRRANGFSVTSTVNAQPPASNYHLRCATNGYGATTLEQMKTIIDRTIAQGGMCNALWHILTPMGGVSSVYASIAEFQAVVDYVYSKVQADLIDVVTISEWYKGLQPVRKPAVNRTAVNPVVVTYTDSLLKEDGDYLLQETGDHILTGTV